MELQDNTELKASWILLTQKLSEQFGEVPDLQTVLFLIGVQELGKGPRKYSKDEKKDLMHIAVCRLLSYWGLYELEGLDADGWPHWKETDKLPFLKLGHQEYLLMQAAVLYFKDIGLF